MNNSSKKSSTFKLLFLLSMLLGKELNKNEIVEEFNNSDIQFNKISINKYISILKSSGINILTRKENNENYYKIPQKELEINLNKEELLIISQVKRLLIAQKDYKNIRRFMRILYKYSKINLLKHKFLKILWLSELVCGVICGGFSLSSFLADG